ncbi:DUF4177 domain-containing protein [Clostridium ganghwense]|uniref:DUF4177 domain-containing protein n=1 Tax=Clostridium ganghwense TaxID=312089 RepID=A0ABT4CKY5_9CLOT|nr:DUF4177 domain-containing protein [Clostridium ganghwense]MCY6369711.1 DUF4177 domain-containing protein [Clostridium ganghwense]
MGAPFTRLSTLWKVFFLCKETKDYHKIIEEYAAEGWRLIQNFAPPISGYGSAPYY